MSKYKPDVVVQEILGSSRGRLHKGPFHNTLAQRMNDCLNDLLYKRYGYDFSDIKETVEKKIRTEILEILDKYESKVKKVNKG